MLPRSQTRSVRGAWLWEGMSSNAAPVSPAGSRPADATAAVLDTMFGGETADAPEPAPLPPATTPGGEEEDAVSSDEEARADSVYGEDGKKRRTSRIGLRWSGSPAATSAESIRLKRIMLGLVALALCPALAIGISTAAGYIVFNWNEVGIAFAYVIISEALADRRLSRRRGTPPPFPAPPLPQPRPLDTAAALELAASRPHRSRPGPASPPPPPRLLFR